MMADFEHSVGPDLFGQLATSDPYQRRSRRLFQRGLVVAVHGNEADLHVGYDAHGGPLELKQVPVASGYVPRVGDWVAIEYEAGQSGAPWVTGPSMAEDSSEDPPGIGVFSVSSQEPADPPQSMIYFDESRSMWRGWDGSEWVDLSAKLHNQMADLQGGAASEYYHFTAGEHDSLQDFVDGSCLSTGYIKRLQFQSIPPTNTRRSQLFERNGDFYLAINATYDSEQDRWNRVDTSKYAYLIVLHSKNNIPTEPIGGVVWWRAVPGQNPIGDWTALGGWELGFMMTEHRNFVMGGMNLEADGSGSPPYGRFSQIGSEDSGGLTLLQRNSWAEGSGSWGRDAGDKDSAAVVIDPNGDLLFWWYPDQTEGNAPWTTSQWHTRGRLNQSGSIRGRLDIIRSSAETAIGNSAFLSTHKTSGDMADGFGAGYAFAIEDAAGVENIIAAIYGVRAGADDTGALSLRVASGGSLSEGLKLTSAQLLLAMAGSASAPAIARDGFSDDGVYWPADGQVGIAAGGALRASVRSDHLRLENGVGLAAGMGYSAVYPFYLRGYFADTSGTQYGLILGSLWQPSADHTGTVTGLLVSPGWLPSSAKTLSHARSVIAQISTPVKGATISNVYQFDSLPYFYASADATTQYTTVFDFYARQRGGAGSIGTRYAFYVPSGFSTGVTTPWGLFIDDDVPSRVDGKLAVGANPPANQADVSLLRDGVLALKETTAPTADAGCGKLYTKSDNKLYFQDGDGVEHQLAFA